MEVETATWPTIAGRAKKMFRVEEKPLATMQIFCKTALGLENGFVSGGMVLDLVAYEGYRDGRREHPNKIWDSS